MKKTYSITFSVIVCFVMTVVLLTCSGCTFDQKSNADEKYYTSDGKLEAAAWYEGDNRFDRVVFYDRLGEALLTHDCGDGCADIEYFYDRVSGEIRLHEYDAESKLTKTTCYDADGSVAYTSAYEYGEDGKITSETVYDGDGNFTATVKYGYNTEGMNGSKSVYDAEGVLIRYIHSFYYNDGTLQDTIEYDADNVPVKATYYSYDGSINRVFDYCEDGKSCRESYYLTNGHRDVLACDAGIPKKLTVYNADGEAYITYECSSEDAYIKYQRYDDGDKAYEISEFDANGVCVKITQYDSEGAATAVAP